MRKCSFKEAVSIAQCPTEFRCYSLLEQAGWSDEVEMLARLLAFFVSKTKSTAIPWRQFLPEKYWDSANYSHNTESNDEHLIRQLQGFIGEVGSANGK